MLLSKGLGPTDPALASPSPGEPLGALVVRAPYSTAALPQAGGVDAAELLQHLPDSRVARVGPSFLPSGQPDSLGAQGL